MSTVSRLTRRFYTTVVSPATKHPSVYNNYLSSFRTNGVTKANTINQAFPLKEKKLFEWMDIMEPDNSDKDHQFYLNLIAKTKGLEAAECYFHSLASCTKMKLSYEALLNCYCEQLQEEKAKTLFDQMFYDLKLIDNTFPFNNMMDMYLRLGKPDKVYPFVGAMKQRDIFPCDVTYSLWMQSCGSLNDLDGAEHVLHEMEIDQEGRSLWDTFANIAEIYMKAGLYSKAESVLESTEKKMRRVRTINLCKLDCYRFLMSSYARTSNVDKIYWVWGRLKKFHPEFSNANYHSVLQALSYVRDVNGIKKIFAKWKSKCPRSEMSDDEMKVVNVVIKSYLKENMYKEAEGVFAKMCKGRVFVKTRELFMIYLLENSKAGLAAEQFEEVVTVTVKNQSKWWSKVLANKEELAWSSKLIRLFLLHFEKAKDVDGAEEFCRDLTKWSPLPLDSETYTALMKIYVASGRLCAFMRKRLERHGIQVDEEQEDLLNKICP